MRALQLYRLSRRHAVRRRWTARRPSAIVLRSARILSLALVLLLVITLGLAGFTYAALTAGLPSPDYLPSLFNPTTGLLFQPTRIYDRSGQNLLLTLENPGIPRRFLPINPDRPETLSPRLVLATTAYHEPGFWQSPGISLANLTNPEPLTIAEKLVDRILLEQEEPGLPHALRMRLLAAQLTARFGRTRVLEWYLNSTYYGHLAYGADQAAQLYLGKPATDLSLAESALLVAASNTPALNPLDAPAAALEQQQAALARIRTSGLVGESEYQQALRTPPSIRTARPEPSVPARAFSRLAASQLEKRIGRSLLERGGLQVLTTLDSDLQAQAVCTLQVQLARLQGKTVTVALPDGRPCSMARLLPALPPTAAPLPVGLKASMVILDPQNGQVLALVGDLSLEGESSSLQAHEPGSLLTPFIAMSAFTRGSSPSSLVWDIPTRTEKSLPPNPDGKYHGPQRMRLAVANDYLTPIAGLLLQLGPGEAWRLAELLGLRGLSASLQPQDLIYRGGRLTPLDLAQAYGVFARQGILAQVPGSPVGDPQPVFALQAADLNGRVILAEHPAEQRPLLSPPLAYLVHNILSDENARRPSLGSPNPFEIGRPVGAKIGRLADSRQVWAVGYVEQLVVAVWLGLPESNTPLELDPAMPAGIWYAAMQYASRNLPPTGWKTPDGISRVDVCDPSGQLPTPECPTTASEVFLTGSEPTTTDILYRVYQVNRETNRLATVFTPLEQVIERTYLTVPPEAREWALAAGLSLPPEGYDIIQAPAPLPYARISSPAIFGYAAGEVAIRGVAAGPGFVSHRLQVGRGLNPRTWTQIGAESTIPVENGILGVWNTQGLEGVYSIRLMVVRQDQKVEIAATQVTIDNTPPVVRLLYPTTGQRVTPVNGQVTFQAEVTDNLGVARVEWILDGQVIGSTNRPPFVLPWPSAPGAHLLQIKAYDLAGNATTSPVVGFAVTTSP